MPIRSPRLVTGTAEVTALPAGGQRLGIAAGRLGAVAAIAGDQRAAGVIDADRADLAVDPDRVDRLLRRLARRRNRARR